MESRAKIINITYDEYGNPLAIFALPKNCRAELNGLLNQDIEIKTKKYRPKRSKNANSYMWELCEQIAEAVNISKEDVYIDAIKHRGIYKDFEPLPVGDARTLAVCWSNNGTGWFCEQVDFAEDGEKVIMRCYYGSSCYNTKQMSRLIDYIVEEAKNLDIETLTPDELLNLKSQWKGAKINA